MIFPEGVVDLQCADNIQCQNRVLSSRRHIVCFFFLYISPLPEVYRIFLDFLNGDIYDSVLLGAWARIQIQIKKISKESKFRIAFFFWVYRELFI